MRSKWFTSTFVNFLKFLQIKVGRPNFLGGTNSAKQLNYFVPPSVFHLQKFEGLKFFVIHWILMGSTWLTSTFANFLKFTQIKDGDPNFSGETHSAEQLNYLLPPFCISIRQIWETQILCHSLGFNRLSMIHQHFSQFLEISLNKRGGT